jgi:hypothetical protein
MLRVWMGIGMLAVALATAGGCCSYGGRQARLQNGDCGDGCEVGRPGLHGRVAACREARAGRGAVDECGGPHCGPLSYFFSLLHFGTYCGCDNQGCGERYLGEWDNSPDGCDSCGGGAGHTGRISRSRVYDDYETPAASVRGSGCKNCKQGDLAARSSRVPGSAASKSSAYAPRIVSQNDRVVRPAKAAGTAEQVAEPNQAKVQR